MSNPWMTRGAIPLLLLARLGVSRLARVVVTLTLSGVIPIVAGAQQQAAAARSLVFDGVTVVDVEHGRLIPAQRVVIAGNRIKAVGTVGAVKIPNGAQVVEARGKYLIPGLWDMHTHSERGADIVSYPLLLANGVTGIRDAGSSLPLDTLRQWRREILAGTRVGPPRQLLSGPYINRLSFFQNDCSRSTYVVCISDPFDPSRLPRSLAESFVEHAHRIGPATLDSSHIARARQLIDSLGAAGVDMLKPREIGRELYFLIAAEARRRGIPFGGHAEVVTALEASDSGARIIDHLISYQLFVQDLCGTRPPSVEQCRSVAERLRRNGTWLAADSWHDVGDSRFSQHMREFWAGTPLPGNWLRGAARVLTGNDSLPAKFMRLMQEVDMPILAASDWGFSNLPPRREVGFVLHANLAGYVALGFTPLHALQTATLNPAKMLRATDSLGTVAPGKLADLVLLDADPLADITNTTTIRAVVANGRYFDRAALDALLAKARADSAVALAPITAFVNVSVIPMDRERVLADQTVVVQGGRITALGPANTVAVPLDATRIRGDGMFLMPGLGDCHVHLGELGVNGWRQDPAIEDLLFTFVANGITTVRDMHSGPTGDGQHWGPALRERIARGEVLGPRLYVAGDPEHRSPAAAAQSVRALKAAGYNFVKFSTADSLYDSIVATARRVGLPVVGHALGSGTGIGSGWRERLGDALTDRWSSVEHLTGYAFRITGRSPLGILGINTQSGNFPVVADSTLRRVALETKNAGVWNCPTPAADEVWDSDPFNEARRWERTFDRRLIKALHANGAMILLGTDAGSPRSTLRPAGGFAIHRALELLVEAGLTPYQALETGTRNFAQYLNVLDSAGTVAVGKRADLVLLKANPLVNVGNTRALAGVMVAGRWLSREAAQAYVDTLRVGRAGTCRSVRGKAADANCKAPPTPDARKWGSPDAQLRLLSRMIWR